MAHYSFLSLSTTACMVLCLLTMRDLALQGFGTRYEGEAWATYSNPGVEISCIMNAGVITPVPPGDVESCSSE